MSIGLFKTVYAHGNDMLLLVLTIIGFLAIFSRVAIKATGFEKVRLSEKIILILFSALLLYFIIYRIKIVWC